MNIKKLNIIYALTEPKELGGGIRYIGQSAIGEKRCKQHKKKYMLTSKTHKNNWIKSLFDKGLTYDWMIIENLGDFETDEARDAALNEAEIRWIKHYKDLGINLTNSTDGGEGTRGNILSPETRAKMSEKRLAHFEKNGVDLTLECYKRKEHRFIDEIEQKHCSNCDNWKALAEFSLNKGYWDGHNSNCKECMRERVRKKRAENPTPKLTEDQLKQSYIDRKEKIRQGVINSYKERGDEIKSELSKARSKPIIATGEFNSFDKREFASALEAKKAGFQNSNIGQAIKSGKPYKGYYWKFK